MTYEVMTKSRWLEMVHNNANVLRQLISDYRPSSRRRAQRPMVITAPAAEVACQNIREDIVQKETVNPVNRWDKALAEGDVAKIISLLESAWFGVPESTECWSIPGFNEAVNLLDDPPDEDETRS